MKPEAERWAEALLAIRLHGDRAPDWIAERIEALAYVGDETGVARSMDMAAPSCSVSSSINDPSEHRRPTPLSGQR